MHVGVEWGWEGRRREKEKIISIFQYQISNLQSVDCEPNHNRDCSKTTDLTTMLYCADWWDTQWFESVRHSDDWNMFDLIAADIFHYHWTCAIVSSEGLVWKQPGLLSVAVPLAFEESIAGVKSSKVLLFFWLAQMWLKSRMTGSRELYNA